MVCLKKSVRTHKMAGCGDPIWGYPGWLIYFCLGASAFLYIHHPVYSTPPGGARGHGCARSSERGGRAPKNCRGSRYDGANKRDRPQSSHLTVKQKIFRRKQL